MGNAFPERDCTEVYVEEIPPGEKLIPDDCYVPPAPGPICETDIYNYPMPDPEGFDNGDWLPSTIVDFDVGPPQFEVTWEPDPSIGPRRPLQNIVVRIPSSSSSSAIDLITSDENDAGAYLTAVDGLITIASAVLKELSGDDINFDSFKVEGSYIKAWLDVNGDGYIQIPAGQAITPGIGEWGVDTKSESFLVRISVSGDVPQDNGSYFIKMIGIRNDG